MKNKYFTLLALTLGDGTIHNPKKHKGSKLAYLDIAHQIKNSDYIEWKANLINSLGYNCKVGDKRNSTTIFKKVYTKGYHILEQIRLKLYVNNTKIFKKKWIKNLNELHLAILWMDDGCFIHQRQKLKNGKPYIYNCGEIATQSFDLKSNENIVLWLKKFNIDSYIIHNKKRQFYYIRFNRNNLFKLVEIIKPYVNQVNSMKYKIGY